MVQVSLGAKDVADSDDKATSIAGKYRTPTGGNLLFGPIAQTAFAKAVRTLRDSQKTMDAAANKLGELNLELPSRRWAGVLWNSASNTMMMTTAYRDLAADLTVLCR